MLEDSVPSGLPIQSMFLISLPETRFLWARTVDEARTIAIATPISLFLVDVELPDGNGIDFAMEMSLIQPEAPAVVMTGNPLPAYREQVAGLGSVRFFEKPLPYKELLDCVRDLLAPRPATSAGTTFEGTLRNLTPIDLIQLKCMANATTVIQFQSAAAIGRVFFEKGRMIHAETAGATGETALAEIVSLKGGTVVEEPFRAVKPSLFGDWQSLLMNAAHAQDEQKAGQH